MGQISF